MVNKFQSFTKPIFLYHVTPRAQELFFSGSLLLFSFPLSFRYCSISLNHLIIFIFTSTIFSSSIILSSPFLLVPSSFPFTFLPILTSSIPPHPPPIFFLLFTLFFFFYHLPSNPSFLTILFLTLSIIILLFLSPFPCLLQAYYDFCSLVTSLLVRIVFRP